MYWSNRSITRPAIVRSSLYFFITLSFSSPSFATGNESTLSVCSSALSHVSQYVKAKRQLAAARLNANAITAEAHQQLTIELDDVEASVSIDKCMAAGEGDFQLYQCLADKKGNHAECR